METSAFITVILLAFVSSLWIYFNKFRSYVFSLGIPVERKIVWKIHKTNYRERDEFCLKRYGRLWVDYVGTVPDIVVAEPVITKEILIKHFDSFTNRKYFGVEEQHMSLIDARDDKWGVARKALTPTFTSGKLKGMTKDMDKIANYMMAYLDKELKRNSIVNVKALFQCLSLDTIANCAFGIETNSFENPDNELAKRAMTAFSDLRISSMAYNIVSHLLEWLPFFFDYVDVYGKENYAYMSRITRDIVSRREASRGDFIDRLKELLEEKKLPEEMIMAQGIGFFIAGFETSSNTMSTLCYNLAKYPQIQDKIYEEITNVVSDHDNVINHESINQMVYLEAAIEENLRMYPPVTRLDRECDKDVQIGDLQFKKGTNVILPIWALHHDPDFFPNPQVFSPERFLKDNKESIDAFAYIPFGGGPRKCIGMRFAMTEMKIALAKLLYKFRIIAVPQTKLEFNSGDPFFLSYSEVFVKLQLRN